MGELDGVEAHIEASFPPMAEGAKPTLTTAWDHLNYVLLSKCTGADASASHALIRRFLRADINLQASYEDIQKWKCPHDHGKEVVGEGEEK